MFSLALSRLASQMERGDYPAVMDGSTSRKMKRLLIEWIIGRRGGIHPSDDVNFHPHHSIYTSSWWDKQNSPFGVTVVVVMVMARMKQDLRTQIGSSGGVHVPSAWQ